MEEKNKKILYISIAIALAIGVILSIVLINKPKKENVKPTSSNLVKNEIKNQISNENEIDKSIVENKVTEENKVQEEIIVDEQQEVQIDKIEKEEDNKQKAINIAKKDWGEDKTVYFTFEQIDDNGNYIVYVRESNTTRDICWYTIDINNETFTKEP